MKFFSDRLKELRLERDLSQESLGDVFSLSKSTISLYESGKREPDYETLKKLSKYFNCSTDYLLGKTDIREPPEVVIETAISDEPELLTFWKELVKRKDLQLLFKQVKPMTPEGVKKIIRVIKAIEEEPKSTDR